MTHAAEYGGAELSLLELFVRLDRARVLPELVSLSDGPVVKDAASLGVPAHIISAPQDVLKVKRSELGILSGGISLATELYNESKPVIAELEALIKSGRFDVVYTNSSKAHILGGLAGRRARKPVIWHFRDYHASRLQRMFFAKMAQFTAGTVICNSAFTAKQFVKHDGRRIVLNGLPAEEVKASRPAAEVRAELGIGVDDIVAGTAGRLESWKGLHIFIRAAALVAVKQPLARFVIAGAPIYGDEAYRDELEELVRKEGIADRVIFTGFRRDIYDVINAFDVYVHPSVRAEPFGRGIVEAMLLGKPVLASALGGPLEIVVGGATGLFFLPGDTPGLAHMMSALMGDPERRERFGAAGRRRAETNFSAERVAAEIMDIIYATVNK